MLDSLVITWFLLPLGAALGWALARSMRSASSSEAPPLPEQEQDYLTGLEHLVNEDPDRAVAALVHAAEVRPETIELHITLGNLFRKRGEVDRALRLHENLLQRGNLSPQIALKVRLELAQDYHKAGLIEHAEKMFQDLVRQGVHLPEALDALVAIYEQMRDWPHAIESAQRLESVRGQSLKPLIAQYSCERAEAAGSRKDYPEMLRLAARALSTHAECVRASLLEGAAHEARDDFAAAAKAYRRVPEQDPRYLREVIEPHRRCQEKLQDLAAHWSFLDEAEERWPDPSPVLAKVAMMRAEGLDPTDYLASTLHKVPSWAGTLALMESLDGKPTATPNLPIKPVREAMQKLGLVAAYHCHHCGLKPRVLFWQCPSCKQWGSITPAIDPLVAATQKKT